MCARLVGPMFGHMTPPRDTKASSSQELETLEQLRARIAELEQQLESRPSAATGTPRSVAQAGQPAVIAVLAGTVLVTTPLALMTVKRWWHWWAE